MAYCTPVLLATAERTVVVRSRALGVITLEDLGIGVTKLDGDVALKFGLETHSLRDGTRCGQ